MIKLTNSMQRNFARTNGKSQPDEAVLLNRDVYCEGGDVYFYDYVDPETQILLIRYLNQARDYIVHKYADTIMDSGGLPDTVHLHINSPGGYLSCGFALYDFLKNLDIPVYAKVEGVAASAASLILCGCAIRTMTENSFVLCHELSGECSGKYSEMKDYSINSEVYMEKVKKIYAKETKIPQDKIDEMLNHDLYWDGKVCKAYGLVDHVDENPPRADVSKLMDDPEKEFESENAVEKIKAKAIIEKAKAKAKKAAKTTKSKKAKI